MDPQFKKLVLILWSGFIMAVILLPMIYFYEGVISENTYLILIVLLFSLPGGIAHLYLLGKLIKVYKYKLLVFLPLLIFPKLFVLVLVVGPFAYLAYITVLGFKANRRYLGPD